MSSPARKPDRNSKRLSSWACRFSARKNSCECWRADKRSTKFQFTGGAPHRNQYSSWRARSITVAPRRPTAPSTRAETAAGSRRLRSRLADDDISPFEVRAIQRLRGLFRFLLRAHLDEAEALRAAAEFVDDDPRADHRSVLREVLLEPVLGDAVGKIAYVQLCSHWPSLL